MSNVSPMDPQPQKGTNWLLIIVGGCGVVCLLCVLACGGFAYWVRYYVPNMIADTVRDELVVAIEDSDLSDEEKTEVIEQVNRVNSAFKAGDLSFEDVERVGNELEDSPLVAYFAMRTVEAAYLENSGLSDEEKVDGRRTIQRLARGVVEKTISQSDLEEISDGVTEMGPNGEQKMKESISDEELRTLLADAKQLADEREIPDEEFVVDLAGEVRKMVDVLLGE